jgi:poly(A) polymerase Pap1
MSKRFRDVLRWAVRRYWFDVIFGFLAGVIVALIMTKLVSH